MHVPTYTTRPNYNNSRLSISVYLPSHHYSQAKAESPRTAEHNAFIECELKEGNPARIQLAFERAITDDPLQVELWARYTKYIVCFIVSIC